MKIYNRRFFYCFFYSEVQKLMEGLCMKMSYTNQIRCRVALLAAGILLMLAYMVLVGETGGGDSRVMSDFARGVANFIFFCGLGVMVWRLAHNCKLLGDRRRLKEQLLKERKSGPVPSTPAAADWRWT